MIGNISKSKGFKGDTGPQGPPGETGVMFVNASIDATGNVIADATYSDIFDVFNKGQKNIIVMLKKGGFDYAYYLNDVNMTGFNFENIDNGLHSRLWCRLDNLWVYSVVGNYAKKTDLDTTLKSAKDYTDNVKTSLEVEIEETKAIAKGRATGYVFDTEADMNTWLEDAENVSKLVRGDNLYIIDTEVPDYWWDGAEAQKLETQKVDLTEYAKTKDVKPFVVNVSVNDEGTLTADKNAYDLRKIHESGRQIILRHITMDTELNDIYDIYCMSNFFYDDDLANVGFMFTNISGKTLKIIECRNYEWYPIYSYTYATTEDIGDIETALENKADKPSLIIVNEPNYTFEFADLHNKIVRAKTMDSISFNIETGEYSNLYEAELCFDSGETPTRIDYIVPENPEQIQVINWVGVDCANTSYVNSEGETVPISVFSPVANKHYEISFQYNGTQLIAWVGGFTPASGNVVSA